MRHIKPFIALFIIISLTSVSFAQELRFGVGLPILTRNKLYTEIEVQTRHTFEENATLNKNMATVSIEYDINKHFEIGGSYRLISKKNTAESSENKSMFENEGSRATLDFTYKTKSYDKIRFKNKVRYQVSDFDNYIEKSFLRNKTLVYYKASKSLKPYAGLEFIYRLEKKELKSFRIHLGNKIKVYKHEVTGFFIIENEFKDLPVNLNYIAGIKILI